MIRTSLKVGRSEGQLPASKVGRAWSIALTTSKYHPQQKHKPVLVRSVKKTLIPSSSINQSRNVEDMFRPVKVKGFEEPCWKIGIFPDGTQEPE